MKKLSFRIKYRLFRGAEYAARVIDAPDLNAALKELGSVWSIGAVSLLCAGNKADGEPCSRFSSDEFCCEAHGRPA
jgi:hypothetical protein